MRYNPPNSYSLLGKEYSSAWGHWGYAYGQSVLSYGPTKMLNFSAGTKVSLIIGVIGAIYSGGISAVLMALGATVVGVAIDTTINGNVYTKTETTNYEIISQNKLGLKTNKKVIQSLVTNKKTGKQTWVHLSNEGDTRSLSNLIHAGIYNVVLQNK